MKLDNFFNDKIISVFSLFLAILIGLAIIILPYGYERILKIKAIEMTLLDM
jgi:hypothetical protein